MTIDAEVVSECTERRHVDRLLADDPAGLDHSSTQSDRSYGE